MLSTWLPPDLTTESFLRKHFQRAPLATPKLARTAIGLLHWGTIQALVEARADMMLVRNSHLVRTSVPKTFEEVQAMFRDGYSVVLRRCEAYDDGLRFIARTFEQELEGDVSIQVYATPGSFHSFGWHYDVEDVFIAQTAGTKEYFLRENTVNPKPHIAAMPRDMHYEREQTPTVGATLIPGDWLYVPRGWWHVAKAREDALSISVGVLSPAAGGRRRRA